MEVVFDDRAIADLEGIFNWIAQDSPEAARRVTDRLFRSIELLASFPFMGHVGHASDTYESCRVFRISWSIKSNCTIGL